MFLYIDNSDKYVSDIYNNFDDLFFYQHQFWIESDYIFISWCNKCRYKNKSVEDAVKLIKRARLIYMFL